MHTFFSVFALILALGPRSDNLYRWRFYPTMSRPDPRTAKKGPKCHQRGDPLDIQAFCPPTTFQVNPHQNSTPFECFSK